MISSSSSFDSSTPATSSKVMRCWFSVSRRARDLPKLIALPPPACIWRMKNTQRPISTRNGTHQISICCQTELSRFGRVVILRSGSLSSSFSQLGAELAVQQLGHVGGEGRAGVFELAAHVTLFERELADLAGAQLGEELGVAEVSRGRLIGLEHRDQSRIISTSRTTHTAMFL